MNATQGDLFETLAGIIKPVTEEHTRRYYNTTNLSGDALIERQRRAGSQTDKILAFFRQHPDKSFTPYQVLAWLDLRCPVTSVRRAMTNLTDEGLLIKTDEKRPGAYGELNYCWKLKNG